MFSIIWFLCLELCWNVCHSWIASFCLFFVERTLRAHDALAPFREPECGFSAVGVSVLRSNPFGFLCCAPMAFALFCCAPMPLGVFLLRSKGFGFCCCCLACWSWFLALSGFQFLVLLRWMTVSVFSSGLFVLMRWCNCYCYCYLLFHLIFLSMVRCFGYCLRGLFWFTLIRVFGFA